MMKESGYAIDKKEILLPHPIKDLGVHSIHLKLKEDVTATFTLEIQPEGGLLPEEPVLEEKEKEEETTKEV